MYIIVVYDVQSKRVAKVCKYLRRHLTWVQNSVFEGELTPKRLSTMTEGLQEIVNTDSDSILIYRLYQEKSLIKQVIGVEKNTTDNIL